MLSKAFQDTSYHLCYMRCYTKYKIAVNVSSQPEILHL